MWDSVPRRDVGHLRQCLPSPPTTHFSPLGLDFVLGLSGCFPTPLLHPHPHWGPRPDRGRRARREDTLAGQTRTWWSGDPGSCPGPAAHTLRSLGKDFLSPALRAPTSSVTERLRGTQAHLSSGVVGFTWSFIQRGSPSPTPHAVTCQSLRTELRDAGSPGHCL